MHAWLETLPEGMLNQWIAWDKVEPMGESWLQTASIVQAINLPLYAQSGQDIPEAEVFMPPRYKRPKKRLSDVLFGTNAEKVKDKVLSMFGGKK